MKSISILDLTEMTYVGAHAGQEAKVEDTGAMTGHMSPQTRKYSTEFIGSRICSVYSRKAEITHETL